MAEIPFVVLSQLVRVDASPDSFPRSDAEQLEARLERIEKALGLSPFTRLPPRTRAEYVEHIRATFPERIAGIILAQLAAPTVEP